VRLLLDTHVLLWWLADDPSLPAPVRDSIADDRNVVAVSAVSAWEIAIKRALGKLLMPDDLEKQIEVNGFVELGITVADGLLAGSLPRHHADPFDRMLVAQSRRGGFTLVTHDRHLEAYGVELLSA
jgi:PIN domain nuclease of toxin-antitoxin system